MRVHRSFEAQYICNRNIQIIKQIINFLSTIVNIVFSNPNSERTRLPNLFYIRNVEAIDEYC